MKLSDVKSLQDESGMTAEQMGEVVGMSGMTLRRWYLQKPATKVAPIYAQAIVSAIFKMIENGRLNPSGKSAVMARKMTDVSPQRASLLMMESTPLADGKGRNFEENIVGFLSRIGQRPEREAHVSKNKKRLGKLEAMGRTFAEKISSLSKIGFSLKATMFDRSVAIGALFYLLQAFDLIPDIVPVFGFIDDFGVLMVASSYLNRKEAGK